MPPRRDILIHVRPPLRALNARVNEDCGFSVEKFYIFAKEAFMFVLATGTSVSNIHIRKHLSLRRKARNVLYYFFVYQSRCTFKLTIEFMFKLVVRERQE